MNRKDVKKSDNEDRKFWDLRALFADLGAGFLIYLMIVIILLASKTIPSDFLYEAF